MVSVADCERVQTAWFAARATATWTDAGLRFTDGVDGLNLMFPTVVDPAALGRALDRARDLGRDGVGAWLGLDTDPGPLAAAGFERGWSPWWMAAELERVAGPDDPRVELQTGSTDYGGEHAEYADQLALTREQPPRAFYAAAYDPTFAGRAWSFVDGPEAGIFDMAVWPPFRRRGIGTALLRTVCAAARTAGAERAVLNATPEGYHLYRSCGFVQLGAGITWWWRPPAGART